MTAHVPKETARSRSAGRFRRLLPGLGALLLGSIGVAYLVKVGPFAPTRLEQARRAAERGHLMAAAGAYRDHLEKSPEDSQARLELAEMLKPVDADAAFRHLRQIPADDAQYLRAQRHIAHIAVLAGEDDIAEDAFQTLANADPNDFAVVLSLAELYYRTERHQEALAWTRQAVELQPERAQSWLLLAEVLDGLGRVGEMVEPLRTAIRLDPGLYAAHANLAYSLQFSGVVDEAESKARWCLEQKPDDVVVLRVLAQVLRDRGEHEAALEQIQRALSLSPNDVECRIVEADLLLFQRQAEKAYASLKPLYPAHANRRDLLDGLARAAAMTGRREEALRYRNELVDLIEQ